VQSPKKKSPKQGIVKLQGWWYIKLQQLTSNDKDLQMIVQRSNNKIIWICMNTNKHNEDLTHITNNTRRSGDYKGMTNDFIWKTSLEIDGVLIVKMATL
jgi:hypothetical protein